MVNIDPVIKELVKCSLEEVITYSKMVRIASECKDENDKQISQMLLNVPSFLFEFSNQELKAMRIKYLTYLN